MTAPVFFRSCPKFLFFCWVWRSEETYSTRLASFSLMFMAATRAAARSAGDAFGSHTVLLARGPLAQSGKSDASAERGLSNAAAKTAHEEDLIFGDLSACY